MQNGLREDRKITEYEKKKRFVTSVIEIVGAVVFGVFAYLAYVVLKYLNMQHRISWTILAPLVIVAVIEFLLYLTNIMICSVLDHIIEMCYANQYRALRDERTAGFEQPRNTVPIDD